MKKLLIAAALVATSVAANATTDCSVDIGEYAAYIKKLADSSPIGAKLASDYWAEYTAVCLNHKTYTPSTSRDIPGFNTVTPPSAPPAVVYVPVPVQSAPQAQYQIDLTPRQPQQRVQIQIDREPVPQTNEQRVNDAQFNNWLSRQR